MSQKTELSDRQKLLIGRSSLISTSAMVLLLIAYLSKKNLPFYWTQIFLVVVIVSGITLAGFLRERHLNRH